MQRLHHGRWQRLTGSLRVGKLSFVGRADRARIAAGTVVSIVERLATVGLALEWPHKTLPTLAVAAALLAALFAAGRALRAATVRRLRAALVCETTRTLLAADLLVTPPANASDSLAVTLEGLNLTPLLIGEQLPTLAANIVASVILIPLCLSVLPLQLAIIGALSAVAASLVVVPTLASTVRWAAATQEAFAAIYEDLAAVVGGRLEIVASGRDPGFSRQVTDHVTAWRHRAGLDAMRMALASRAPALAALVAAGLALFVESGRRTIGHGVPADVLVLASVAPTIAGLLRGPFDVVRSAATLRPFFAMLDVPTASFGPEHGAAAFDLPASIVFERVSFTYPSGGDASRQAIVDFSDVWLPRTLLALKGPNGSGKSTLLRLLLGIGRPTSGRINVGGVDLSQIDLRSWRRSIAYLPQRPFLPERATVAEAVRLIATEADDETISSALTRVDLWTALASTHAGEPLRARVATLSAGQRQRVAIARMLCQTARVCLLDEPDANLDSAGVELVASILRELAVDHMVLFAAHTPELLAIADRVIAVERGRVASE